MCLISTILLVILMCLFIIIILIAYDKFHNVCRLWERQNVPTLKPTFPLGNLSTLVLHINFAYVIQRFYTKLKASGGAYAGLFFLHKPVLLVLSPEFANIILVKDFKYFTNRGIYYNKQDDPLSANLFFIDNDDWRMLRNKMTPTFANGKIKLMFNTIYCVATKLVKHLNHVKETMTMTATTTTTTTTSAFDIEITDILARYNTDIIARCAFGINCNSINEPSSIFRKMGKKMLKFSRLGLYAFYGAMLFPVQAKFFRFRIIDKTVSKFIINIVRQTLNERKRMNIERDDFMQSMMRLLKTDINDDRNRNTTNKNTNGLTMEDIAAQVFVFYFAGFETSTSTMTYALYELAMHQQIQQKVRKEIQDVCAKHGDNRITYDGLQQMIYLDKVIYETMRKNPSVGTLHRIAKHDYKLPCGAIVPKGTFVIIPVLSFHHDQEYFEQPTVFDPERFNKYASSTTTTASSTTTSSTSSSTSTTFKSSLAYLPFGKGPRTCLGVQFGMFQTKLGLCMLLKQFQFEVCAKTDIPLNVNNASLLLLPGADVWLRLRQIA